MLVTPDLWPPFLLWTLAALQGLIIGSFLNVLILRLPQKMYAEQTTIGDEDAPMPDYRWFGLHYLITPSSQCPQCQQDIRAWQNIPVISWLLLRARCANCQHPISIRYPLIELLSGLLTFALVWHFGASMSTLYLCILVWGLIALTVIDIDEQLLPDQLTLPLLWLGLLVNLSATFTTLENAIIGAVVAYLSLWFIFHLFYLVTGKEGMGYGDFKLFAVFGAWFGWNLLPQILFISSLVGILIGGTLILVHKQGRQTPIPFGPYLAIAGLIAIFWGHEINQFYLAFTDFR